MAEFFNTLLRARCTWPGSRGRQSGAPPATRDQAVTFPEKGNPSLADSFGLPASPAKPGSARKGKPEVPQTHKNERISFPSPKNVPIFGGVSQVVKMAWLEKILREGTFFSPFALYKCTKKSTLIGIRTTRRTATMKKLPATFFKTENGKEPVRDWLQGFARQTSRRLERISNG